jgi:hypothetical protein
MMPQLNKTMDLKYYDSLTGRMVTMYSSLPLLVQF